MKKRVMNFFTILISLVVLFLLALVLLYNSDWAKEKCEDCLYTSFSSNTLKQRENEDCLSAFCIDEGDYVDLEFRVKELDGGINITVYAGTTEDGILLDDYYKLMFPQYQVMCVKITEIGTYRYSLDTEHISTYVIYVELCDGATKAVVDEGIYKWSNNWTNLMYKLGIKKEEIDVDALKSITE